MSSSPSRSRLKRFAAYWRSSALRGVARQSDACPRKRLRDPESVVPGFTFTGLTFTSWGHSIEEILSAVGRRRNSYVREDGNSDAPRVSCVRGFLTPLTRSRPFFDLNSRNSHAIIPCDWFHWCQRTKCNLRARAEFGLHLDSSEAQRGHRNRAKYLKTCGGQGRNRTADASLFRAALYQLSYLAGKFQFSRPSRSAAANHTFSSAARASPVSFSTSACRLLPCASIVTIAMKSRTRRCHIASGIPNSIRCTPSTFSIVRA